MKFMPKLVLDQAGEGDAGGGAAGYKEPESEGEQGAKENAPKAEGEGSPTDFYEPAGDSEKESTEKETTDQNR